MNCREFESEFTDRTALSEAATLHLQKCPNCQKLKAELTRLWQMFESLPAINAPADFNLRLKGRMKTAQSANNHSGWWRSPRFIAPVSAIILLAFLVLAAQNFFVSKPETAGIVQNSTTKPQPIESNPVNSAVAENPAKVENNLTESANQDETAPIKNPQVPPIFVADNEPRKEFDAPAARRKRQNLPAAVSTEDAGGSSRTSSVKTAPVYTPRGIPSFQPQQVETSPDLDNGRKFTAEQFFEMIGIKVEDDQMPPRVKSVTAKSIAENSNIKAGDVIEAVDEIELAEKLNSPKLNDVKKLKIRRDGKLLTIILKTN